MNANFVAQAVPIRLGNQARINVQGTAGAEIGVRVWGREVSIFKAGADARLTTCGGNISREAKLFDFDIDPGFGDELPEVDSQTSCEKELDNRRSDLVQDALSHALEAKKYAQCLGPISDANEASYAKFCTDSLRWLDENKTTGYTPPTDCSTRQAMAAIPNEWVRLYGAYRDNLASNVSQVLQDQQAFIQQNAPQRTLPFLNRHESFTAFHIEFEYPVGPVSVIVEIALVGGWGIDGSLQTVYAINPMRAGVNAVLAPELDVTAVAFAGIGIGPVAVGIGGELVLLDLQTPLTTGASVAQTPQGDTRPSFQGLPYAFGFGPTWSQWTGDWTFGARSAHGVLARKHRPPGACASSLLLEDVQEANRTLERLLRRLFLRRNVGER